MVNWTKRASKAAKGILRPGESVLAGANLREEQFEVLGGGATGGAIAGGVAGALVGRAWDKRQESKRAEDEAARPRAAIEDLPVRDIGMPKNGCVAAVTNQRLVLFAASSMGMPKAMFYETAVGDIDTVYDREVEQKLLRGTPASRAILIVFRDQTAIPLWGISAGPSGKWLDAFLAALRGAAA